jgi:acetyltransferase-like isoleucine patch superfamily enzyme
MTGGPHPGAHVAPGAELADDVELAPGAVIHAGARIGAGSRIGSGAVVHANTRIGERSLVEDGAVLGKTPRLRRGSSAAAAAAGRELGPLVIGPDVTVCCGAVLYAGTHISEWVIVGDQAQVRERSTIGAHSVVGRASAVDFGTVIGARVLIQTNVYITGDAVIEDDVFVGPGVVTTNDHSMSRHPPGEPLLGPVLRRACRVGGGAVLTPGVEIGEEAFVAAGAVVTRDVAARAVVMGVPARVVRMVPDADLLENWIAPRSDSAKGS